MPSAATLIHPTVHDAQAMRRAGGEMLSLALMDARNRTLGWLSVFDGAAYTTPVEGFEPPTWLAGHAGWFQERWIARHLQRRRGARSDGRSTPLASVDPRADGWFDVERSRRSVRWAQAPTPESVRGYLAQTLDTTLELLDKCSDDDDSLYVFRLALAQEDRAGEQLAALAQAAQLAPERWQEAMSRGLWAELPSRQRRDPLWLPSQTWTLGSPIGGWVPEAERWAHAEPLPEFEIDSQPVCWAQLAEFIDDGGYDERRFWTETGWQWLQAQSGRRTPRYVEQVAGGVLALRQGRLQRVPAAQSVVHVCVHEAEAWCHWAGRRLPTETEWELAACTAASRGFAWGDVLEWAMGSARAYPAAEAASDPAPAVASAPAGRGMLLDPLPPEGERLGLRVLRGGSAFGSSRLRHPRARRYAWGEDDARFTGFRSCAL